MINNEINKEKSKEDIFIVKTTNECLKEALKKPKRKNLFLNVWKEADMCILFGDNNTGKSIYAVQIASEIADNGKKVAYFDFELSDTQFAERYSLENEETGLRTHHNFSENFFRIWINSEYTDYKQFKQKTFERIERLITEDKFEVLIFDNITALMLEDSTNVDAVGELLAFLSGLKGTYKTSVMLLAHTPKRNPFNPITKNDLAGTKMLSNLADAILAIGVSTQGTDIRYVVQIKSRHEKDYQTDNVIVYEVAKETDFLQFKHLNYSNEKEHLLERPENDKQKRNKKIIAMKIENCNLSLDSIMQEINKEFPNEIISRQGVKHVLDKADIYDKMINKPIL